VENSLLLKTTCEDISSGIIVKTLKKYVEIIAHQHNFKEK
jgi:hypothetical protein